MENETIVTANAAATNSEPKHKWLANGSRFAKKAILYSTTIGVMSAAFATQAFAATGEVIRILECRKLRTLRLLQTDDVLNRNFNNCSLSQ
ncbi:MAG: hypothetical protein LUG26_00300 [Ruminococcus sp.]|nr:hypothetical protein [Ruminococcus sp.]